MEPRDREKKTHVAFWEGFRAGLTVIGGIVGILLLFFWFS